MALPAARVSTDMESQAGASQANAAHDVRALIDGPAQLVFDPRYRNVQLNIAIDPYLPEIMGDKGQIQEAIACFVAQALTAMEHSAEPRLTLTARYDGNAVEIAVAGSGTASSIKLPAAKAPYTQAHFSSFP